MIKNSFSLLFILFYAYAYAQVVNDPLQLIKENTVVIDIRNLDEYKIQHLPNSVNLPLKEMKEIIAKADFDELKSMMILLGISPHKEVYILPALTKDEIITTSAFAYMLNSIGIHYVYILSTDLKAIKEAGIVLTDKPLIITPQIWEAGKTFDTLTKIEYQSRLKSRNTLIANLDSKLEKNKKVINSNINSLFYENNLKTCEEINKIFFTGKVQKKKDIILKSKENETIFALKYILSKHCGYDNVFLFKKEEP